MKSLQVEFAQIRAFTELEVDLKIDIVVQGGINKEGFVLSKSILALCHQLKFRYTSSYANMEI